MTRCYIEWCALGFHAGSHSETPYTAPATECAPTRCYCGKPECRAAAYYRPIPLGTSQEQRDQYEADWQERKPWRRGDGEHRKRHAMTAATQSELGWQDKYVRAFAAMVMSGQPFTSEDVTARVGIPEGRPNAVGAATNAALRQAATRGIKVKRLGYVSATRANQHATKIAQYKGEV